MIDENRTTIMVQHYLDKLALADEGADVGPVIAALLGRSAGRLQLLCNALLFRAYPRLTRGPIGLGSEELLGAVVERLLKALRETRPESVRGFFALASRHIRWELNEVARKLDREAAPVDIQRFDLVAPELEDSTPGLSTSRILGAIEGLPEEERETFDLVRIHGMSYSEAAEILEVSTKTIQRRLNRALHVLGDLLADLGPNRPLEGNH